MVLMCRWATTSRLSPIEKAEPSVVNDDKPTVADVPILRRSGRPISAAEADLYVAILYYETCTLI